MPSLDILGRLAIALAIGLLIGLERGWSSRDIPEGQRAAGLRTLGLTGLLGGLLAAMAPAFGPALVAVGFAAVAAVLILFQRLEWRTTRNVSATGVVAGMLAYAWGAYAVAGETPVAIAGAVATTVLLAFKQSLHGWVRALSWMELRALLVLLVMTALVLPLLPDRAFDPWEALNPRRIWLLAVLVAGVSFAGYFAMRVLGGRGGLMLSAFAGGLASSTATTLSFARLAREQRPLCGWLAGGTLIADAVMGVRVPILAAAVNRSFAMALAWPMLAFALVSLVSGLLLLARRGPGLEDGHDLRLVNPVELGAALKFAAIIAVIMLLSKVLADTVGEAGVYGLAALSGLADVDALTLSVAQIAGDELAVSGATVAVLVAVTANTLVKTVIAVVAGTPRHGLFVGLPSAAAIIAALVVTVATG